MFCSHCTGHYTSRKKNKTKRHVCTRFGGNCARIKNKMESTEKYYALILKAILDRKKRIGWVFCQCRVFFRFYARRRQNDKIGNAMEICSLTAAGGALNTIYFLCCREMRKCGDNTLRQCCDLSAASTTASSARSCDFLSF